MDVTAVETPAVAAEAPAEPVSRLRQLIAERFPDKHKETVADEPKEDGPAEAATETKPEAPGADDQHVEEKKVEPKRLELQLAKAQAELRKLTAEQVRAKDAASKAAKELEDLRGSFAANPLQALEKLTGRPLKDIFEEAKAGKFDVAPEPKLPPEVQALVERERARAEQEKAEAAAKEREAEKEKAAPRIRELIDVAGEYPFLGQDAEYAVAEMMFERLDKGETPNVQAVIAEVHQIAKDRATFWYTQKDILRHALTDPKVRSAVEDALGLAKQTPSGTSATPASKPPASVGTLREVGSRSDTPQVDRDREIREEWARARNAQR